MDLFTVIASGGILALLGFSKLIRVIFLESLTNPFKNSYIEIRSSKNNIKVHREHKE